MFLQLLLEGPHFLDQELNRLFLGIGEEMVFEVNVLVGLTLLREDNPAGYADNGRPGGEYP